MRNITTISPNKEGFPSKLLSSGARLRSTGFNKKELYSEIDIEANPEKVWRVLSDLASFPDWNPFMRSIKGELVVGKKLVVRLQPTGARGMTFKPTILTADRNHEIRWIGHLLIPGLFDGEHILEIVPLDGGKSVRFVQREKFGGLLLPFLSGMLTKDTSRGFVEMNKALKERAERP
jgi:hypothetical protein